PTGSPVRPIAASGRGAARQWPRRSGRRTPLGIRSTCRVARGTVRRRGSLELDEALRTPLDPELARGRHVAEERGRRDNCRTREIAEAADTHAVRPVAVERGDGALALPERVGTLTETLPAPRLADLGAGRAEDVGDRLATESWVGLLDVALHAA